jgi:hypothetical protein
MALAAIKSRTQQVAAAGGWDDFRQIAACQHQRNVARHFYKRLTRCVLAVNVGSYTDEPGQGATTGDTGRTTANAWSAAPYVDKRIGLSHSGLGHPQSDKVRRHIEHVFADRTLKPTLIAPYMRICEVKLGDSTIAIWHGHCLA